MDKYFPHPDMLLPVDKDGNIIMNPPKPEREYPLAFAYAIEEAYKKDPKGFDSMEAFAAHTIAAMLEKCLLRKGNSFKRFANEPKMTAAYNGCNSSTEYMLYCIHSAIMTHTNLDDEFFDEYDPLIHQYRSEILEAHPEILDDKDESFYFEGDE